MNTVARITAAAVAAITLTLSASPANAVDFSPAEPHPTKAGYTCLDDRHLAYLSQRINNDDAQIEQLTADLQRVQNEKEGVIATHLQVNAERDALRAEVARKDARIARLLAKLRQR